MACPYFMPAELTDHFRAARAPLGRVYTGACHAGPEPVAPADEVLEYCNFGYGRSLCPRFPDDAGADAVRFTHYQGQLIYILEREYSPVEHGTGATLDSSTILGHQAAIFAANTPFMTGRPVRESASEYSEIALPNDANPLGNLLGGRVMHLVDLAGALAATRHSRCPVVTASVDSMTFLHPVHIGQLLILKSSVNRVFRTSMEVGVKVWVEDLRTGDIRHTSSAYLTFVALGPNNERVPVPPVIPETEEEKRRYDKAGQRREYRLAIARDRDKKG